MGLSPFTCIVAVEHVIGAASLQPEPIKGVKTTIIMIIIATKSQRPTQEKQSMAIWG